MEVLFLAVLLVLMAVALGSGFPVAFSLPGAAILSIGFAALVGWLVEGSPNAYFAVGGPSEWLTSGVTNLRGIYWEVERDTLIAIPLFIFMGIMLQRSKIAEDLLITMAQLFGPVPGGLGISVVFVGALLAATTGIVGATVVAMGLISLPAMLRNGYSKPLATGTIAASGTLGQIIPPSIVLIILADQLASATDQASSARQALYRAATGEISMPAEYDVSGTSAGEMFLGAFVPGLVLVGIYMLFILAFALLRPKLAPAVPYDGERNLRFWGQVLLILVPPLALIFLVLGSIIGGVATVNQAGAIGAAGALVMAGYRLHEGKRGAYWPAILAVVSIVTLYFILSWQPINIRVVDTPRENLAVVLALVAVAGLAVSLVWSGARVMGIDRTLQGVMLETAKTSSLVFIILLGAAMLTAAFRAFGGEELVKHFLEGLPGGFWTQFIIVMAVIFILGFFLDFIEIAVVVVPIVAPILLADPGANITAVWLGVMIGLNIQTSFLTPPFGFALFYLRGVAPREVKTTDMYKGVIAFITLQLAGLAVVGVYPPLVNYLPQRTSLLSETAPPPRNPRLQACIEDYLVARIETGEAEVRDAVAEVRRLDLSYLPEDLREDLTESFDQAERAVRLLIEADQAAGRVEEAAVAFKPLLVEVRGLERDIRAVEAEIEETETTLSRLFEGEEGLRPALEAEVERLREERETLLARIPDEFEARFETFSEVEGEETGLRRDYRRAGDTAARNAMDVVAVIESTDAFAALEDDLRQMLERIRAGEDPADLVDPITDLRAAVGDVEGARDLRSEVNDARSALRDDDPDPAEAAAAMERALALHAEQMAWRSRAQQELLPALEAYLERITATVGVRQRDRMPREMALAVAACESRHRDLSLRF